VDIGQLTLDDGQLCPLELEQALQGDSLLLMACSAGYYQLAQVLLLLLLLLLLLVLVTDSSKKLSYRLDAMHFFVAKLQIFLTPPVI